MMFCLPFTCYGGDSLSQEPLVSKSDVPLAVVNRHSREMSEHEMLQITGSLGSQAKFEVEENYLHYFEALRGLVHEGEGQNNCQACLACKTCLSRVSHVYNIDHTTEIALDQTFFQLIEGFFEELRRKKFAESVSQRVFLALKMIDSEEDIIEPQLKNLALVEKLDKKLAKKRQECLDYISIK